MVGVMKRVEDNSYLEQRVRVWWYNRRVPRKFAHFDTRKRIKESLGTMSLEQARYMRNLLAEVGDHYWALVKIAEETGPSSSRGVSEAIRRRYKMATMKVLASGFTISLSITMRPKHRSRKLQRDCWLCRFKPDPRRYPVSVIPMHC